MGSSGNLGHNRRSITINSVTTPVTASWNWASSLPLTGPGFSPGLALRLRLLLYQEKLFAYLSKKDWFPQNTVSSSKETCGVRAFELGHYILRFWPLPNLPVAPISQGCLPMVTPRSHCI